MNDEEYQPEEFDAFLSPSGALGSKTSVSFNGRFLGEYPDDNTAERELAFAMREARYYPNIWYVSDHGNAHLIGERFWQEWRELIESSGDRTECHICGEETTEGLLEPIFIRVGLDKPLVVHGHYQLASYDHGRRPSEELSVICLEEMAALGDNVVSADDRELYLADDTPPYDDFDYWEFVHESVWDAESNLPEGYYALSDGDMGTWSLWALDRDHWTAALERYAAQQRGETI